MFNLYTKHIFKNLYKTCYIASRDGEMKSQYGNPIPKYNKPQKYEFNYQPISGSSDIQLYGERVRHMYKAFISYETYNGLFKEGDAVYLNGATPENETETTYGHTANYYIYSVNPQNTVIELVFDKLQKNNR